MATSHGHGEAFVPSGPTHDLGYEPDKFGVKTILAVPAAVIITGLIAFTVTWILFANIFDPNIQDKPVIPAAENQAKQPADERVVRISSTDPKAPVENPRLEGLQKRQKYEAGGMYPVTDEIAPTQPAKDGNSPRFKHTDLWPENVKLLHEKGGEKVPIDQAMKDLLAGGLLKSRAGAPPVDEPANWDRPKESNGGRYLASPQAPAAEAGKKEPEKKDEKKE